MACVKGGGHDIFISVNKQVEKGIAVAVVFRRSYMFVKEEEQLVLFLQRRRHVRARP